MESGACSTLQGREVGRYASRMRHPRLQPHSRSRPLWLLAMFAWLSLMLSPALQSAQVMDCCGASLMAAAPMAMHLDGHGQASGAMGGVEGTMHSGHLSGAGGQAPHAGCMVCLGAVWLACQSLPLDLFSIASGQDLRDLRGGPAPDGDWRRRLRPPSLA